eukprot:CAMPEP_0201551350 /NCGR_PEP_ID=MMETSP0173_2-20130828/7538_1 /ASSEMBLY_ACC=CAM_ASM_000268 /TAXON_ID=218659 /ORGANISM="Vexillifera sp., Strain DIVA3 564/2" /LENGTH=578 /DNA_ID=CAMNT_0047961573 /DNA_START=240 /DNA_END=1972 /DNA_ORIENTATION=-
MSLEHLLIMPVQRIPRYNLLLSDLIKKTSESHPDFVNLNKALLSTKQVADHVNKSIHQSENLKKLIAQSSKGVGFKSLLEAHRKLLLEGVLNVDGSSLKEQDFLKIPKKSRSFAGGLKKAATGGKSTEEIHFYLFNDKLVFAHKSAIKKQKDMSKLDTNWPLNLVWVENRGGDSSFRLIGPNRYFVVLSNDQERNKWFPAIKKAIDEYVELASASDDNGNVASSSASGAPDERTGSFEFYAGATYSGQWRNGKMHGVGRFEFAGNVYEGEWCDGVKEGKGRFQYATGVVYEGEWRANLPNGKGTLSSPHFSFEGQFENNRKIGDGVLKWESSSGGNVEYQGTFNSDFAQGQGRLSSDTFDYQGLFSNGRIHGQGKMTLTNGTVIEGSWKHGMLSGAANAQFVMHCTQPHADTPISVVMEGEWADDQFHSGMLRNEADGTEYQGTFLNGKREGKGSEKYVGSCRYAGKFKQNQWSGKGEVMWTNGDAYKGLLKANKFCGTGLLFRNKVKIEGTFSENQIEGKCTLTLPPSATLGAQASVQTQKTTNTVGETCQLLIERNKPTQLRAFAKQQELNVFLPT